MKSPTESNMGLELALQAALGHVRSGALESLLASLLEAWRIARSPRIAELVELTSTELTKNVPPLRATNRKKTAQAVWLAAATEPRPALLERLFDGLVEGQHQAERFRVLRDRPPDPRMSAWALRRIRALLKPAFGTYERAFFHDELVATLDHVMDPRLLPIIEQITTGPWNAAFPWSAWDALRAHRDALRTRPVPLLPDGSAAVLDLVRERVVSATGSLAPFFAAVYAEPRDDAARAVLGDLLQQRGDPRGELIALQLARASTGKRKTSREIELERAWSRDWRGALAPALDDVVLERGFPARGRYIDDVEAAATAGIPEWATVTHLDVDGRHVPTLLFAAAMRSLRHVTRVPPKTLHALLNESPRPWTSLGILANDWRDIATPLLALPEKLPALTRLAFDRSNPALGCPVGYLGQLVERWPALDQLEIVLPPTQIAELLSLPVMAHLKLATMHDGGTAYSFDRGRRLVTVKASSAERSVVEVIGHLAPLGDTGIVDAVDFELGSRSIVRDDAYVSRVRESSRGTGLAVMLFGRPL